MSSKKGVKFYKLQGSGNDFVIIPLGEGKRLSSQEMKEWARKMCTRKFSVGADGLIFIDPLPEEEEDGIFYRWHFYNSDGSRAEMCGNGARCVARIAYELGIAPCSHIFLSDVGRVEVEVYPEEKEVKVHLTKACNFTPDIEICLESGERYRGDYINTGVPHFVLFFEEDISHIDVKALGREIRFHRRFAPGGTNVNFVQKKGNAHLSIRTYERGVEDETYACGTGAAASAYIALKKGYISFSPINVTTSGGETLLLEIKKEEIFLRGPAKLVYKGEFYPEEVGLSPVFMNNFFDI